MQSKRSSFNPALFRKNLSRSWPLWGGLSVAGSLGPLYLLLGLLNDYRSGGSFVVDAADFADVLYAVVTTFVPIATAFYAILCAMLVWSYLDSPRAVGLMHTLPIHRSTLFVTNALSGLAMMLIPYVVVGGFVCIIAACYGFFHFYAVMQTVAAVLLMTLLFFGMATLCAMVTGSLFAMPALYLVLNVAAPLLSMLMSLFTRGFLLGVVAEPSGLSVALSPCAQIMNSFQRVWTEVGDYGIRGGCELEGLWVVALYGLAGLMLLGLSWLLYRVRRSERAGDVVAFRWLRPVFQYGLALISAFTLGWLLYTLLWGELFQRGNYADLLPMLLCTALCGVVGYAVAAMLLEKSLRVFHRRTALGALITVAAVAAVNLTVSADLLGIETRVPDLEDVRAVDVRCDNEGLELSSEDGELIEKALALHRAIVEDLDFLREETGMGHAGAEWETSAFVSFEYTLKSGGTLRRNYYWIPVDSLWAENDLVYDDAVMAFANDPALMRRDLSIPKGFRLGEVTLENHYAPEARACTSLTDRDARAAYDALLRDVDRGNYLAFDPAADINLACGSFCVELEFRTPERQDGPHGGYMRYRRIYLTPAMTETLDALQAAGAITGEELDQWLADWSAGVNGGKGPLGK